MGSFSPGPIYNTLIAHIKAQRNQKVIVTASSGIAALILHDGHTAHSRFRIPVPCNSESTCNITATSELAQTITEANIIIWDEAPMHHRHTFEAVDRTLRDILENEDIFGGKIMVFGGDFRQVLPVVVRGTQGQIENACLKNSYIWESVETLRLTQNIRVLQDPANLSFVQFLL